MQSTKTVSLIQKRCIVRSLLPPNSKKPNLICCCHFVCFRMFLEYGMPSERLIAMSTLVHHGWFEVRQYFFITTALVFCFVWGVVILGGWIEGGLFVFVGELIFVVDGAMVVELFDELEIFVAFFTPMICRREHLAI